MTVFDIRNEVTPDVFDSIMSMDTTDLDKAEFVACYIKKELRRETIATVHKHLKRSKLQLIKGGMN